MWNSSGWRGDILYFLNEILTQHGMKNIDLYSIVNIFSNRETATLFVSGQADAGPGTRVVATEFGLTFINFGWESLDFAVKWAVYFWKNFQKFLEQLGIPENFETSQKIRWLSLWRNRKIDLWRR